MKFLNRIAAAAAAILFTVSIAQSAMTDWQDLGGGKARLVASLNPANSEIVVVVDVALEPGWKTYWREPGGAGIPPRFDFSQSDNFLAGEAAFPVPDYLTVGGIKFPGYKDQVRFVISGTASELSPEGTINLDLLIGVCEEICIPATASFALPFVDLLRADPGANLLIADARTMLPKEKREQMAITGLARNDGKYLEVTANLPSTSGRADLFAEAPPGWYVSPARLVSFANGEARFEFKAQMAKPASNKATARFRLTLAGDDGAIEQWHKLDAIE